MKFNYFYLTPFLASDALSTETRNSFQNGLKCGTPYVGNNQATWEDIADKYSDSQFQSLRALTQDNDGINPSIGGLNMNETMRIVNGEDASVGSWPWQVKVSPCSKWKCTYLCGGSILSDRWVMTAAHCVPFGWNLYGNTQYGTITAGMHVLNQRNSNTRDYAISHIVPHEGWNRYLRTNDVALVRSANAFVFSQNVQPVCTPSADICFNPETTCIVTGWGYTEERGNIATALQELAVKIIKFSDCNQEGAYKDMVYDDSQICAGWMAGGKDSCAGDSGGPLVCRTGMNMPWMLYGVVSWGWGCARAQKPGVYSKMTHFKDWIDRSMRLYNERISDDMIATPRDFPCAVCQDLENVRDKNGEVCRSWVGQYYAEEGHRNQTPAVTTTARPATPEPTIQESQPNNDFEEIQEPGQTVASITNLGDKIDVSEVSVACGGKLTAASGFIATPGFLEGTGYDSSDQCVWIWKKAHPRENIKVKVVYAEATQSDKCWTNSAYLSTSCNTRNSYYCDGDDSSQSSVFTCGNNYASEKSLTLGFSSQRTSGAAGYLLAYEIVQTNDLNQCGLPKIFMYNENKVNFNMASVKLKPNTSCSFFLNSQNGKNLVLHFGSKTKK